MRLQRRIQHRVVITHALASCPGFCSQALEQHTPNRFTFGLKNEEIPPRIVDKGGWSETRVCSTHERCAQCREARPRLFHYTLQRRGPSSAFQGVGSNAEPHVRVKLCSM